MMSRLLLIDAYAQIYRAYYAFINAPRVNSKQQNTSAVFGFCITLDDLIKRINPTHIAVAFDPKGKTFRHEAYEQYKAQRAAAPEDIHAAVPIIKEILKARNIVAIEQDGFEADDVIGTLSKRFAASDVEVYMATPDKDYGQLVGDNIFMYRPRHNGGYDKMGVAEVCEKYELQSTTQVIDYLGLMGDASDNIPGCPGIGPKTAVKLLSQFGSIDSMLEHIDDIKGSLQAKVRDNIEQIRFSKYLVTIRTDVPIEISLDDMQVKPVNKEALADVYRRLEFNSLLKGLGADATPIPNSKTPETAKGSKASKTDEGQLDLFAMFETGPTMEPEQKQEPVVVQNSKVETITASQIDEVVKGAEWVAMEVIPQDEKLIGGKIQSLRLSTDGKTVYTITSESLGELKTISFNWLGYDLKRQIMLLKQSGIEISGKLYDIAIAHYLLQPEMKHELDYLSTVYLQTSFTEPLQAVVALQPVLDNYIDKTDIRYLFEQVELPLIQVLAQMELAGVRMDVATLQQAQVELNKELQALEQTIQQEAGKPFNINSPSQVGDILFDELHLDPKAKRAKSGHYSTSEEVLLALKHKHKIVADILEYRAIKKLLSTYIEALPELINPQTGKIHTSYNQTITSTGRLSSSNPNLQNLPIRTERGKIIRKAVVPDEGCVFFSADYSQIELRIMAHLSQDDALLEAFHSGEDIHSATAAKIYRVPLAEVTSEMRRHAKTANFGIIYGVSAFGLAERLDISRSDAKQLIEDYFVSFPKVQQYIEDAKQRARDNGYAETLYHRRRYLPDIISRNPTVRGFAERNAVNAPIQGTAADIIKIAMVAISRRIKSENLHAQMIMQVHDELNFNVPEQELEQLRKIVVEEMQHAAQLSVPLIADCGNGPDWLTAH